MQSGRGDLCGRPCHPANNIALGNKKIFWGHPKPRARGYRPLRIPGYAGISYPSLKVKDHHHVACFPTSTYFATMWYLFFLSTTSMQAVSLKFPY